MYDFKTKDTLSDANPPYGSHLIQTALYAYGLDASHAAIIYVSQADLSEAAVVDATLPEEFDPNR